MFGRSKDDDAANSPQVEQTPAVIEVPVGKGRPTPTRKQAEAANRRPLVPADRKAASKEARAVQRAEREKQYQAMQSGDERYLPAKDKGPVRRYIRMYVDARWNLGELFLPIAVVVLLANIGLSAISPSAAFFALIALYVFIIVMIVDTVIMWRKLKKKVLAKFGPDSLVRGTMMYAVTRVFQFRRARLPKPQNKHGEWPA
ncbi:DUF3043 domain-containing protein [Cellulomonas sp. NPDC089187]|uniref:DUF3043 domain-containing protein n=1 Tax=Cellulomonas sp. NPDC089187 TaxID=3154970 RepID=UPI00341E3175